MRRARNPAVPVIARVLLLALTPGKYRAQIEGDLREGFQRRCEHQGRWPARVWYWRQLLSVDVIALRREVRRSTRRRRAQSESLTGLLTNLWDDVRYAGRSLRKSPAFTLVVVITLATGIGANSAIFTVVNAVLLRPLPYSNPDELVMVFRSVPRFGFARSTVSYPDFADWRERRASFFSLAAYGETNGTYLGAGGAERFVGSRVTADLIPLLGARPAIGRFFVRDEDRPGTDPVVVLSHALWQGRFGADSALVGGTVVLDGESHTVVGIMPADFTFPSERTAFWVPLRGDVDRMERDTNFLTVIGRLAPGVSVERAQADLDRLAARIDATAPAANQGFGVFVEPRHEFVVRNARVALFVFLGAVALVLLIACANVANLVLARGTTRQREMAMRAALGAGRNRLVRQLLTESAVLGLAGGLLGVAVAAGLLRALLVLAPSSLPRASEIAIDPTVLGFTGVLSVGCGLALGTVPAVLGSRVNLHTVLKEGGQTLGMGRWGRRVQRFFVVGQVALAVTLSVGSALLVNSFVRLTSVAPGFDPEGVVAARVTLPPPQMQGEPTMNEIMAVVAARSQFFIDFQRRASNMPGVTAAGLSFGMPFGPHGFSRPVVAEDMPVDDDRVPVVGGEVVAGDYFDAMRIPLSRGRVFNDADAADAPSVALVNETMARLYWRDDDPIGKRIRIGDSPDSPWTTVVGVVGDVSSQSLAEDRQPLYYRPLSQAAWPDGMFVVLRSDVAAQQVVVALRRELTALNPELPLTDVAAATELIDRSIAGPRFRTLVLSAFGFGAIALALIGIYAVVSLAVGDRRQEIGIRIALGAEERSIVRMVLINGATLAAIGVGIGLAGAVGLTRFLEGMLFDLAPRDPFTFVAVALSTVMITIAACYLPARRAASIDPLHSLRHE